jgi:hypothetical protein
MRHAIQIREENDPYRLGWRYVERKLPDGTIDDEQVPLTEEDVLFPQEGDFFVHTPAHLQDFVYCVATLKGFCRDMPGVVVLGANRISWGVPGMRAMGPDIVVLFGVRDWRREVTYRIKKEGGLPVLVLEITSPSTRHLDVGRKPGLYYRAGVEKYIIVDRGPDGHEPPQLLGNLRGKRGWLTLPPDRYGRISLAPLDFSLGIEEDRVYLYDAEGNRFPDPTDMARLLEQTRTDWERAESRARKESRARIKAQRLAQQEAQARAALEERVRQLEAELRRRGNETR